jgi:hypothetical protein
MKTVLTVEVTYNRRFTDPEGLAVALDRLLETALSTTGILEEYGTPNFGEFFVASSDTSERSVTRIVLSIFGGVLEKVFCDAPHAKTVLVDWDTEGSDLAEEGMVEIPAPQGHTQWAAVIEYPVAPLEELTKTETLAALKAAGIDWIQPLTVKNREEP